MQYRNEIHWIYDDDDSTIPSDKSLHWACSEYICQIMNLFEMAVEFSIQKHFESEIFLTWVRWFWDVGYTKKFPAIWEKIRTNYTPAMRMSLDKCIAIAKSIRDKNQHASEDELENLMEKGYIECTEIVFP